MGDENKIMYASGCFYGGKKEDLMPIICNLQSIAILKCTTTNSIMQ